MRHVFWCVGFIALVTVSVHGAEPVKPAPAPTSIPDLKSSNPVVLCVDCDQPFDTATHKKVLDGLLNNPYIAELRRALYLQDSVFQFSSKAHFDNCDFDASVEYIDTLVAEAGKYAMEAQKAQEAKDESAMQAAARKAFFALGQAMHGVQDFYAHTNYVELTKNAVKRVTDLFLVAPWRTDGKARIKKLQQEGLVSGFVFWGLPQKCPSGSISHSDLAKDSESTVSGKIRVPHLENISQYRIAVYLARETSLELVKDAFKRWPILKQLNGPNIAFEVGIDRRGIK